MKCRSVAYVLTAVVCGAGLAACGSDDGGGKDDKTVAGAEEKTTRPAPSPSASASAVKRPEIKLPKDISMTFEGGKTGDAAKDKALADSAERMRALNAVIAGTDPGGKALAVYTTGTATEASASWINQFKDAGLTITGQFRYYDRKATVNDDGTATVVFCADESKAYAKEEKTGKVRRTTPSDEDFIIYNTRLAKNDDGIWQTTQVISKAGVKQCVR
ncbi:putative lipoprotein [Streptomyces sp. Tu6071]|uniref:Lipoprotein n=1 Tax=Streptomyces evansiae TaxID=3075535 RepID=A0ABD5E8A0_9ACTN|nr:MULTISPECIES: hypothetical protein [unclassified Streptomyces]EGJ75031.1 putative lipoprotein [Streptomyces sp. Tu6071]MDT0417629.1 hypothetical protein [Streptomyces sp. DSM 41982]SCE09520.1 hypothetical protein GA0115246_1106610 [Streptomyces sp. SolWspMP-sol7th]